MQLSEALRLVRRIEPEAMLHRDHICGESVSHDLAHRPKKMLSQIYAWRVESGIPRSQSVERKPHAMFDRKSAVPRAATSLSGYLETPRLNARFAGTRE